MDVGTWGFEPDAVVVVTGAASGIGRSTAIRCAQVGLRVAAWDVDRAGLDAEFATTAERREHPVHALWRAHDRVDGT